MLARMLWESSLNWDFWDWMGIFGILVLVDGVHGRRVGVWYFCALKWIVLIVGRSWFDVG